MRWEASLAPVTAPVRLGDAVVLGTSDHLLVSVQEGRQLWAVDHPDRAQAPPELGPNGQLLVTGKSGTVYKLDQQGQILWQGLERVDAPARFTPEGGVLARQGNTLTRLKPDGQAQFTFTPPPHPLKEHVLGPFAADRDGSTYVTTGLMLSEPRWTLVKLDPQGHQVWSKPISEPSALHVDEQGNAVVGGPRGVQAFRPDATVSWSSTTHCSQLLPAPDGGYFVASINEVERLDPSGQALWSFQAAGDRRLTTGISGFDMASAPDGTLALTDLTWNWKEFGGAATLSPDGQLLELGREGNVLGVSFEANGNLVVADERGLRAVNPGTQARQSPLVREEEQWIVVGSSRVRRRQASPGEN